MIEPKAFELGVGEDGVATEGQGLLVAVVPGIDRGPAVVGLGIDPYHDPGLTTLELARAAVDYLAADIPVVEAHPIWTIVDANGLFNEICVTWPGAYGEGTPLIRLRPFPGGGGFEAFVRVTGASGETVVEMFSSLLEWPHHSDETPSAREFLEAVECHGSLPAPGAIFHKVDEASVDGDARKIANCVQPDPVISASLINSANAARFASAGKTGSVVQAVTRLGTSFVRRVVFVAEMMARYQKGNCKTFDYRGYWLNAIAIGACMRGLMADYRIRESMADEVFTTGLISGIGWLAVAETFPELMARYIERCRGADPVTKAWAQQEIFPCAIEQVAERYLERFDFPDTIRLTVAGDPDGDRLWQECLARATRVAQNLSPFECLAIPTTTVIPESCQQEWQRWKVALTGS